MTEERIAAQAWDGGPSPSSGTLVGVSSEDRGRAGIQRILVGLDASDHAHKALDEAIRLVDRAQGVITGIHAYAAKLHDRRFRQMEGGLPARYRQDKEMGRQRAIHDDLISRGLNIISDSYHDAAAARCDTAAVPYRRLSPEGKNYRRIVEAVSSGDFDLLVLGSLGLGAVPGSVIGTVCERVARRSPIDTLVIKDHVRAIGAGPLVAALDGSPRAFGALKTALRLGRMLGAEVHAVAAFDPYFHYVAFHRIAGVLSEEAGRHFRFKEQEKLHEEIIDGGIAKIYQSHLDIARAVAAAEGAALRCELLEGKPYAAIASYLHGVDASLLLVGKTGIHADPELDIGGNAENLLRMARCHVWLGCTAFTPPTETVARETIGWTEEAERKMDRVPETVRRMVRMAIIRFAQERGHTLVTGDLIDEATRRFCPGRGKLVNAADAAEAVAWSGEAQAMIARVSDTALAATIRLRAEKRARREGAATVSGDHVLPFVDAEQAPAPFWTGAALARLARVPDLVRAAVKARIEARMWDAGGGEVTVEAVEAGLAESRDLMRRSMGVGGHKPAEPREG